MYNIGHLLCGKELQALAQALVSLLCLLCCPDCLGAGGLVSLVLKPYNTKLLAMQAVLVSQFKTLEKLLPQGLPVVQAPGEAEATCAALCQLGLCDAMQVSWPPAGGLLGFRV
jgi:hypothetical protein